MSISILLPLLLLLSFSITVKGQETAADSIARFYNSSDFIRLSNFAPNESDGTLEFIYPGSERSDKDVLKPVFLAKLEQFHKQHPVAHYQKIGYEFHKGSFLPIAIGKLDTKDGASFYVLMFFVRMEEEWKIISFNILSELPQGYQRIVREQEKK